MFPTLTKLPRLLDCGYYGILTEMKMKALNTHKRLQYEPCRGYIYHTFTCTVSHINTVIDEAAGDSLNA